MKKTALILIGFAMIIQLAQCSSSTKTATNQKAAPTDPAVEACNKECSAAYGKCIQKAGKSESKKAACNDPMVKCAGKCETKAKGYKKPAPEKKSTYSEV